MRYTHTKRLRHGPDDHLLLTAWRDDDNYPRFALRHEEAGTQRVTVLLEDGTKYDAWRYLNSLFVGAAPDLILREAMRNYDAGRPGVDATV